MRRASGAEAGFQTAGWVVGEFGDLAATIAYALAVGGLAVGGVVDGPLRVLLAGPLLFVLPGYAVVAALFPGEPPARPSEDGGDGTVLAARLRRPGVEWVERGALAVGTSFVLLVVLALVLSLVGPSFAAAPLVTAVVAVTVAAGLVGGVRRARLPPTERATLPVRAWTRELRAVTVDADSGVDAALNVALAGALVVALAALAVGLAAPQTGETHTEAALATGSGEDLTAGGYATDLTAGERATYTLTVENREGAPTDYVAVAVLQRVRTDAGAATVLEQRELDRLSLSVAAGETAEREVSVTPETLGEDLRLRVLVYDGEPPANPSAATATEHLALWVDVSPPTGA